MRKSSLIAILLVVSANMYAQSLSQAGIPLDAQTAAMASAGVSAKADGNAQWNNVAATVSGDSRFGTAVSFGSWQPEMTAAKPIAAAGFARIGEKLGLSAGFRNIGGSDIPLFDDYGNPAGNARSGYMSIGMGAAYQVIPGLAVGLTADYHNSKLTEDIGFSAVGIGISGQYRISNLLLGLKVSDLGSGDLPTSSTVGASYSLAFSDKHSLEARAQASVLLANGGFNAGAALQYTAFDVISLRAGYYLGDAAAFIPSHLSLGAGLRFAGIGIDAAYLVFPSELGNSLCITLKYIL